MIPFVFTIFLLAPSIFFDGPQLVLIYIGESTILYLPNNDQRLSLCRSVTLSLCRFVAFVYFGTAYGIFLPFLLSYFTNHCFHVLSSLFTFALLFFYAYFAIFFFSLLIVARQLLHDSQRGVHFCCLAGLSSG